MSSQLVFISHASADAANASQLVQRLEEDGIRCWYAPRDIPPGIDFAQAIYSAMEESAGMVVLLSRAANESEHVAREVGLAAQLHIRTIPLSLDGTTPTGALCYYTRTLNIGNIESLSKADLEGLAQFVRRQLR
jgi:hypothetical protein